MGRDRTPPGEPRATEKNRRAHRRLAGRPVEHDRESRLPTPLSTVQPTDTDLLD